MNENDTEPRKSRKLVFVAVAGLLGMAVLGAMFANTQSKYDKLSADFIALRQESMKGYDRPYDANGKTEPELLKVIEGQRGRVWEAQASRFVVCQNLLGERPAWTDAQQFFENGSLTIKYWCGTSDTTSKQWLGVMQQDGSIMLQPADLKTPAA